MAIQKHEIVPHLWFEGNAEEAASFYFSIFGDSRITDVSHYSDAGPGKKGAIMAMGFELEGQSLTAINAGPWRYRQTRCSLSRMTALAPGRRWTETLDGSFPGMSCPVKRTV